MHRIQIGSKEKIESETINDFNKYMFNYVNEYPTIDIGLKEIV